MTWTEYLIGKMRELAKDAPSCESHEGADDLLALLALLAAPLRGLAKSTAYEQGINELIAAFNEMDKWYA